jgi:hypothetical protein
MSYRKTRKAVKLRGGNCGTGFCQPPQSGGQQRIGLMNPRWGGKQRPQLPKVEEALLDLPDFVSGGSNSCGCRPMPPIPTAMGGANCRGGYRPTKRDLKYLKLWRQGKSIGFTMRSSLKAKGLIPRANGTKRVSAKYRK